jgi:S-formylglutathione hydrolase FrmB
VLLLLNSLVMASAFLYLNQTFQFYSDWPDLFASVGFETQTLVPQNRTDQPAVALQADATSETNLEREVRILGGRLLEDRTLTFQVTGPKSGVSAEIQVTLPASYTDPHKGDRHYPVVQTFSGFPGAVAQWTHSMDIDGQMAAMAKAGEVRETIFVSAALELPRGRDTECVNGPKGQPQVETWLMEDVPNWVNAHFRTETQRQSWAAIGLSAGGWCAAMAALLHPQRYGGAMIMGGYFQPIFGAQYQPVQPGDATWSRYDLLALVRRHPPDSRLWIQTSGQDKISAPTSQAMVSAAKPPLRVQSLYLNKGGHRIQLWQSLLPQALAWLPHNLPNFDPRQSPRSGDTPEIPRSGGPKPVPGVGKALFS